MLQVWSIVQVFARYDDFAQLGHCAYGDHCRYDHVRPDWSKARSSSAAAGGGVMSSGSGEAGYVAPPVPKPPVDSVSDQLPISRLQLGDAGASHTSRVPTPISLTAEALAGPAAHDPGQEGGNGYADGYGEEGDGNGSYAAEACEHSAYGGYGEYPNADWEYYGDGYEENEEWEAAESAEEQPAVGGSEHSHYGNGLHQPFQQQQQQRQGGSAQGCAWQQRRPAGAAATEAGSDAEGAAAAAAAIPLAQWSLCMQYLLSGTCSKGDSCNLVHGDLCELCQRHALHPHDPEAAAQHQRECRLRHERLAARARSAGVECSICLEKVLENADPRERKFGLMACEHPFCLGCIRNWRQKVDGPADVDSALRTCPVCRTTTHFVVPSTAWPATPEDKDLVISGYKAKLGTIDCKHFAFGEGTCPFGTSCFYRHAYRDGRLEEPTLRRAAADEGEVKVLQPVRLSDFLTTSSAGRQLLAGRSSNSGRLRG
ncbi:hypothetical protein N2152v2_002001 [Parachlorella kessleri]